MPEAQSPIQVPSMLLLGSTGRNSGKTVLACEMIRRTAAPVIGLKVSTIHTSEKRCLRGGEGCGVCTSLEGDYCLTVETDASTGKDTARMLAAGADSVFWLRARRGHIREGFESFLSRVPDTSPIICESNSLRNVVCPGVFLMMKQRGQTTAKASAKAVMEEADRVVAFEDEEFDIDPADVSFADGRFILRHDASLILLAGGGSTRMGEQKSMLPFRGRPLIEYLYEALSPAFAEVIVSANEELPLTGVRTVPDIIPGFGPIGGIAAALEQAACPKAFVTACDIPTIHHDLIAALLRLGRRCDVAVPRSPEGFLEPLHAVYSRRIVPEIKELMRRGEKRIRGVYRRVSTCYLELLPHQVIENINTPEEYRRLAGIPMEEKR